MDQEFAEIVVTRYGSKILKINEKEKQIVYYSEVKPVPLRP
jgi:hypothetical protein